MAVDTNARLDIGRVINRTFGAIGGNLVTFVTLAALLAGLPAVVATVVSGEMTKSFYAVDASTVDAATAYGVVARGIGIALLTGLIAMASNYVLVGAVTHGSVIFWNGRTASLGECLSTSLRHLLPLIGAALLVGICCGIGLIALIVPGLILAIMWSVVSPAIVMESGSVTGSMQRSRELTRGNRWRIFWLLVIYFVVNIIVRSAIYAPMGLLSEQAQAAALVTGNGFVPLMVVTALYGTFNAVIAAAGTAALYFELRVLKDGVSTDELAKIFE